MSFKISFNASYFMKKLSKFSQQNSKNKIACSKSSVTKDSKLCITRLISCKFTEKFALKSNRIRFYSILVLTDKKLKRLSTYSRLLAKRGTLFCPPIFSLECIHL